MQARLSRPSASNSNGGNRQGQRKTNAPHSSGRKGKRNAKAAPSTSAQKNRAMAPSRVLNCMQARRSQPFVSPPSPTPSSSTSSSSTPNSNSTTQSQQRALMASASESNSSHGSDNRSRQRKTKEPFVPGRYVCGRGNKSWAKILRAAGEI
jgi:hypothetical protein